MLLGIILILLEVLVIPGFAFTGILGLCSLTASCYFGFEFFGTVGGVITILLNIILVVGFLIFVLRSNTWRKATLDTNITSTVDTLPENKGIIVGLKGIAVTRLAPMGRARFGEVEVEVRSDDGFLDQKCAIEVSRIDGEKIFVVKSDN